MRRTALILILLLAAAPAVAGQLASRLDVATRMAAGSVQVVIEPYLELEAVTVQEVVEQTGGTTSMAGAGSVQTVFERQPERIWTACVRKKKDIDDLVVSYEVVGSNGRAGRLASIDDPASDLPVRVLPLPPRPLGKCPRDRSHWLYDGGARILIDASGANLAGRYTGTIIVVLNNI